jgi:hypothetical protein
MNEREKDLAICQLHCLQTVLSGAGMDMDTAIEQLSLDNKECLKLARKEGLDEIADMIESMV